jgi:hypothetical protein
MARFRSRRPFSSRRVALRPGFRIASACASLALLLLCFFAAGSYTLLAPSAYAEPAASPTPTDTPAPPTATPIPPPSLTLVSPSSGQGPVGARMTLSGAHWTTSSVTIGVALAAADCGTPASWEQTIGLVTPKPSGALDYSFTWPAALPPVGTPYAICALATGLAPASVTYQVRSALPPTLSLSDAVVAPGQSVAVNGVNFIGAPSVDVNLIDPTGAKRSLGKQAPAADGSFSFSYTPKPADLGLVTVTATSPAEGGALPALEASVTVNVQSALVPTATPRPTSTPPSAPTKTPGSTVAPSQPTLDLRAGMVVALTLALLALAGSAFVLYFRLRGERQREEELAQRMRTRRLPVAAGRIGDLESDTDPSMLATGEHLTTRRFAVAGDEDEDGYDGSEWDEDEGPGPDWQPRPMTGSFPIFSDESYPRASDNQDENTGQTGASTSTASGVADSGATVAAEPSSEGSASSSEDG